MPIITPLVTLLAALVSDRVAQTPSGPVRIPLKKAGPGIQGRIAPGQMVVYRTSRTRAETDRVLEALNAGRPGEAFRISTHVNPGLTGHSGLDRRVRAAVRRGERPLFVSPYPTVTYFYHSYQGNPTPTTSRPRVSLTIRAGKKILVLHRSVQVSYPETWASPGGSLEEGDPWKEALREFEEEAGPLPPEARLTATIKDGAHTAFLVDVPEDVPRRWAPTLNWENTDYAWVDPTELARLPLLPPFIDLLTNHWGTFFDGAPPEQILYQKSSAATHEPVTWAIIVDEDALLWENTRARQTNGILYSLLYPDAEFLIDAGRVREIRWVPTELLEEITTRTQSLKDAYSVRGSHRGTFRDRDPALAEAARDAVCDLRVPAVQLGRPFLETPMNIPGVGGILKGQRVLLKDGQVGKVTGARASQHMGSYWRTLALDEWQRNPEARVFIELRGHKNWGPPYGPLNPDNVDWRMIDRPLLKGERVSKASRRATWAENREEVLNMITKQADGYRALLEQRGGVDAGLSEAIEQLDEIIERVNVETPPWESGRG